MTDELIARWDGFLSKIEERFGQIMEESRQGCAMLLEQTDLDPTAMGNAWGAMEGRAKDLGSKIDDTWSDAVEPKFDEADASAEICDAQIAKSDALNARIEMETHRTRVGIFGDAADRMLERARAEMEQQFNCTQCGGPLPIPETFRSVHVPCTHCSAQVLFEPGGRVRMVEHFCVHAFAERSALPQWEDMYRAEMRWRSARDETLEIIKGYERAQIDYWRPYLTERAKWLPEVQATFDADLKSKLQQFYAQLHHEKAWVEAGRPAEL